MRKRFVLRESVWCCFRPRNATPPASPATAAMKREDNSNNFPLAPFPIKYPGKNIFFTEGNIRGGARRRSGSEGCEWVFENLFVSSFFSSLLLRFFCGNLGNCTKSFYTSSSDPTSSYFGTKKDLWDPCVTSPVFFLPSYLLDILRNLH